MKKSLLAVIIPLGFCVSLSYGFFDIRVSPGVSFFTDGLSMAFQAGFETDPSTLFQQRNMPASLVLGGGIEGVVFSDPRGNLWNIGAYAVAGWRFAIKSRDFLITPQIALGGGYMQVSNPLGSIGGPATMTIAPGITVMYRLDKSWCLGIDTSYRIWLHDVIIRNVCVTGSIRYTLF